MKTENFEFTRASDVRLDGKHIGRIDSDGYLKLTEENRIQELADAVFDALHEQLHICGDYEPSGGWPLEMYVADADRETNI